MRLEELPEVPGVRHRMVAANGINLHVAEAGEGPPLLLVHGWPQHWWIWRRVIRPLAQRYRVLAPDLRGHGWSDAPLSLTPALRTRKPLTKIQSP